MTQTKKYNHFEVGHPDNPKPYRVCGARTTKADHPHCLQAAGYRTKHVGEGRCVYHGGGSATGPDNGRWVDGRQAYRWQEEMRQHFREIAEADGNPLDLLPELGVQRLILSNLVADLMKQPNQPYHHMDRVGGTGVTTNMSSKVSSAHDPLAEFSEDGGETVVIPPGTPEDDDKYLLIPEKKLEAINEVTKNIKDIVQSIIQTRNQTALAAADIMFILNGIVEESERFIPDKDTRRAYIGALRRRLPFAMGEEDGAGRDQES